MTRRKRGHPVHGWLVLDKPAGMTSTRAVTVVRRLFDARKAGHAGTLDPLATGVLPIALGEATKTVPFTVEGDKVYRFRVRWGMETNTDDAEGEPARTSALRPTREAVEDLLPQFTGTIMQVPPAFSAIKIAGERAYVLARGGEEVRAEARPVQIAHLALIDTPDNETSEFEISCGKGTYVRALARDMGRCLGCFGHVVSLRRTRVGPFDESEAVTLEELEALAQEGDLKAYLQPIEAALDELVKINVTPPDAARLLQGQPVLLRGRDAPIISGEAFAVSEGSIVALCRMEAGLLRPTRVFGYG
jgi:tRNA pseudouridine55 synthase